MARPTELDVWFKFSNGKIAIGGVTINSRAPLRELRRCLGQRVSYTLQGENGEKFITTVTIKDILVRTA